jgi:tRNA1Val (adenine37-N6)-methyltransferase
VYILIKSKINFNYFQPDDYHFSEDSIKLSNFANKTLINQSLEFKRLRVVDLCAGCGVVGLEFFLDFVENYENSINFIKKGLLKVYFIEKEPEFLFYLNKNISHVINLISEKYFLEKALVKSVFEVKIIDFNNVNISDYFKFDIVLSNPPYYILGSVKMSDKPLKNKCLFTEESSFIKLFDFMLNVVSDSGFLFFLFRNHSKKQKLILDRFIDKNKNLKLIKTDKFGKTNIYSMFKESFECK